MMKSKQEWQHWKKHIEISGSMWMVKLIVKNEKFAKIENQAKGTT